MATSGLEPLVVPAAVALGGAITVVRSALSLPRAFASARWQAIEAEVLSADLDSSPSRGALNVTYHYTVDGYSFVGDRFYASDIPGPSGQAAMIEFYKYRPGQRVVIYYDPREPGRSALRRHALWPTIGWLLAGFALIGFAVTLMGG